MIKFKGKSVNNAVAIGKAILFEDNDTMIPLKNTEDVDAELKRLTKAKKQAATQLSKICESARKDIGDEYAGIFESHIMLLEDPSLNDSIKELIQNQKMCAESAVNAASDLVASMFLSLKDDMMQTRAADVKDVSRRLISCLMNKSEVTDIASFTTDEAFVLCAKDLSPSQTVSLDKAHVTAIVTSSGSPNSHSAILARSMNIPAIVGVGDTFLEAIENGDTVIVDGENGEIILKPDAQAIESFRKKQSQSRRRISRLEKLKGLENITIDGTKVAILANISNPDDTEKVLQEDAGGIGLFRSEFLYLERDNFPSENEQYEIYKSVLEAMGDKPVIIRTMDVGADKQPSYFAGEPEKNPALGMRAIRFCLTHPQILTTQLRALYRASTYGNLSILFPMITSVQEVKKLMKLAEEVRRSLRNENIPYSKKVKLGIMIETPAAALISDALAPLVDFFSIGTNDLTQYTLACDRQNEKLDPFCNPYHEAILRLIKMTADNANANHIPVGICGELAADTSLTEAFLRMGITELSVSAPYILPLRDTVRKLRLK